MVKAKKTTDQILRELAAENQKTQEFSDWLKELAEKTEALVERFSRPARAVVQVQTRRYRVAAIRPDGTYVPLTIEATSISDAIEKVAALHPDWQVSEIDIL